MFSCCSHYREALPLSVLATFCVISCSQCFSFDWIDQNFHGKKKNPTLLAFLKRHFSVAVQLTCIIVLEAFKRSPKEFHLICIVTVILFFSVVMIAKQTLLLPQAAKRLLRPHQPKPKEDSVSLME